MNKRQNNQLRMFHTVRDFVNTHAEMLKGTPMFQPLVDRFDELLAAIKEAVDYQEHGVVGKMDAQRAAQESLINTLLIVSGVLHAYARSVKDSELMAKSRQQRGPLSRMRLANLLRTAEHILEAALAVREKLGPYWLDGVDILSDLQSKLGTTNAAVVSRYQSLTNRVAMRQNLKKLFYETDTFLTEEFDNFLEQYLQRNSDAYESYVSARQTRWYGMKRWRKPNPVEEAPVVPTPAGTAASVSTHATSIPLPGPSLAMRDGNGAHPSATNLVHQQAEVPAV